MAMQLFHTGLFVDPDDVEKSLKTMAENGSRYLELEKALGTKVALVMGTSQAESDWLKMLPYSGAHRAEVIELCRSSTVLQQASAHYAELQRLIVESTVFKIREKWFGGGV
ncbi:hypothetical protein CLAFUR4_13458 [Fulvia fulva]|nr:hypothetical protein CLAFUR4_13458 [Fulvia fulva]WPV36611.1 hypothetical protein CLAFUW7_13462 [Fulvia fulva]